MYSSELPTVELTAVAKGGVRRPLSIDAYVTVARREIPWLEILPSRICSYLPTGTVIEVASDEMKGSTECD